ncbi:hypothetical protein ACI77I_25935 [Pseudomonas sp. D47]|uniref:hypothetical protein n=1 Tax=Pseudomonas sp. D47 TaxID=3159447 RepID=UPI00387B5ACE
MLQHFLCVVQRQLCQVANLCPHFKGAGLKNLALKGDITRCLDNQGGVMTGAIQDAGRLAVHAASVGGGSNPLQIDRLQ